MVFKILFFNYLYLRLEDLGGIKLTTVCFFLMFCRRGEGKGLSEGVVFRDISRVRSKSIRRQKPRDGLTRLIKRQTLNPD